MLKLCRDALSPDEQDENRAEALWKELQQIAEALRVSGGAISRGGLSAKLRLRFSLRDDPCDSVAWTRIRNFSQEGLEEIETTLPGNIRMPRSAELQALRTTVIDSRACHVLGDSGCGKSALIKMYATEMGAVGAEVVWIRADRFSQLLSTVPDFAGVAARGRRPSALLVIDALEGCNTPEALNALARLVLELTKGNPTWSVILACQTPEWARVNAGLVKHLAGHPVLAKRLDCGPLANEDLDFVCRASSSVARLLQEPQLKRLLSSPKMLDVLLTGQLAEDRPLAGEADLVEWWWEQQVRGAKRIAAEEHVARELASRMADELCSELSPDSVAGAEAAANELIRNRVLRRTRDGLLRFEHELLADWARVMRLKGLGQQTVPFIRTHAENPPWLRAVRLLSQHLLDRVADMDRWREILSVCSIVERPHGDPSAENLQVIDAWLEGIIFSVNPGSVIEQVRKELFGNEGWLLRRLIRRMMHVGTIPDPVMLEHCSKLDSKTAEAAATRYRLPIARVWSPIVEFLIKYSQQVTDMAPADLGEIAEMWARLEEYLKLPWPALADVVILNAEKELRREVAGQYRHDSGTRTFGGGNNSRITIYAGALRAAAQFPDRVAKLVSKAAGIAPWEDGDLAPEAASRWLGKWEESHQMFDSGPFVEIPVTSWTDGPTRETSKDFYHAWFDLSASISVYRNSPSVACNATLGFLLDWPKRTLLQGDHRDAGIDHFGFAFEAGHMCPPFYTKGPFLAFFRENWNSALDLIVRLTNFATDRYTDWWPYDPRPSVITFTTPNGEASWLGNHQVYGWSRFNMNTADVVTCALMAFEKWLEEQIEKGESIAHPVQVLWLMGRSLAFAGVMVAVGKRHPELFLNELKPLLFVRELYMLDMSAVREGMGYGFWPRDGEFVNNLRREWETLPGRKTGLLELTREWFIMRAELQPVLREVSAAWRALAVTLPDDSENRTPLLRWASNFDLANWKEVRFPDGGTGWQYEQPEELRDVEGAEAHIRHQALLTLPYQCSEMLDKGTSLSPQQLEGIWEQLHDWTAFEQDSSPGEEKDEFGSFLLDHRHARAGLIAVLLCLGGEWRDRDPTRRPWLEAELKKLLANPPKVGAFTAEDINDDCEGFLARSAVQCWDHSVHSQQWRGTVGSLIAVYRYRTIQRLFEEAFRNRGTLLAAFRELEALALSFAKVRRQAKLESIKPQPGLIDKWFNKWIPKFARGRGPKWTDDWKKVEVSEPFPPAYEEQHGRTGRRKRGRRDYGFDMGVLLAAFGTLPPLADALDAHEREHWLKICRELLGAYIRTLPCEGRDDEEDEWRYEVWKADERILGIVAARLFQCSREEQKLLWLPILNLPPAAHHHVTQFLSDVLIEAIRTDPPRISELLPLWRAMAEHLLASPQWTGELRRKENEVWKYIFLYGGSVSSVRDQDHIPFVHGLCDLFERHVRAMEADPYDQSSLAGFLISDAGDQLLVDALEWLGPSWQRADSYFWERAVEDQHFEDLLHRAWQKHYDEIRQKPDALKAFKALTLNLASFQVSVAIEIQRQIGSV